MNQYIYIVKMGENKTHKVNLKKFVKAVNQSLITESVFLTKEKAKEWIKSEKIYRKNVEALRKESIKERLKYE
jgi:hypothetical protein